MAPALARVRGLKSAVNSNRDFLVRMTSFSLPLAGQSAKWAELRDEVISQLPWLPPQKAEFHTTSLPRKFLKGRGEWLAIDTA